MASKDTHNGTGQGPAELCTGVVIYEDASARDMVLGLYDRLANQFHQDLEFAFEWWGCKYLLDPNLGKQAADAAIKANLILLCLQRAAQVPIEVKAWFERWLPKRDATAGALVVVQTSGAVTGEQDSYFRWLAERAHMDYLPLPGPEAIGETKPGPPEFLIPPATASTGPTPGRRVRSSHHGINE